MFLFFFFFLKRIICFFFCCVTKSYRLPIYGIFQRKILKAKETEIIEYCLGCKEILGNCGRDKKLFFCFLHKVLIDLIEHVSHL